MKKLLALVLALVMTLSLCVTSNAAYTDAADVDLDEAVDVMTAVGVFQGSDGKFDPKANLTREQAAKLVSYLQIGQKAADALVGGGKFADVAKDRWSAGYVVYCASTGVAAGVGDSKFDPTGSLTALQFGKMLLVCLGYDAASEGMVGTDWTINTSKLMASAELLKGLDAVTANSVVTREQAAQMMLNAIKAPMVEYANRATSISVNGADIVFGGSTASYLTGNDASKNNIKEDKTNDGKFILELGEKLFPKLTLKPNAEVGAYGRPANEWKLGTKLIGTYTSANATLTYTANTKAKTVYADLGSDAVAYDWTVYVDGDLKLNGVEVSNSHLNNVKKNGTGDFEYSAKGAVTEIYVDDDAKTITVVEINYYLGKVSSVKTDKKDGTVTATLKTLGGVKADDMTFETSAFEKDDYVVYTVDVDDDNKTFVATVAAPEVKTGKVDRVNKDTSDNSTYIKMGADKHTYSINNYYDVDESTKTAVHPTLNKEYNLFLDPNGYVLGFEAVEEEAKDYLLVTAVNVDGWGDAQAKVVFTDGTKATVDLADYLNGKDKNSNDAAANKTVYVDGEETKCRVVKNTIYKFAVDEDNVYTLYTVADQGTDNDATITNDKAYVSVTDGAKTKFIVDEDTIFVDTDAKKAYTGFEAVPSADKATIFWAYDSNKIADVVFITTGNFYDKDATYFVLANNTDFDTIKVDSTEYRIFEDAYVNGELVEEGLYVTKTVAQSLAPLTMYKATKVNTDGYVTARATDADLVWDFNDMTEVASVGSKSFWLGDIDNDAASQYTANNETVYVVAEYDADDDEWDITSGDITDLKKDDDTTVYAVVVDHDDNLAELVYVYRCGLSNDTSIKSVKFGNTTLTANQDGNYTSSATNSTQNGEKLTVVATNKNAKVEIDCTRDDTNNVTGDYKYDGATTNSDTCTTKEGFKSIGNKTFKITVTAEDGVTSAIYWINKQN